MRNNIALLLLVQLCYLPHIYLVKAQLCPEYDGVQGKGNCTKDGDCFVGCGMKTFLLFILILECIKRFTILTLTFIHSIAKLNYFFTNITLNEKT